MASVNKVILMGNLGRDPEVRYSPDGAAVCNVSIATTSSWKDKTSGERREETEWHRVVFYNRLAEIAGEYLRKGRPVYVEGRIKTRKWQNKEGVDQFTTEVVADNMQLLGGREAGEGGAAAGGEGGSGAPRPAARAQQAARPSAPAAGGANLSDMDDDIPCSVLGEAKKPAKAGFLVESESAYDDLGVQALRVFKRLTIHAQLPLLRLLAQAQ